MDDHTASDGSERRSLIDRIDTVSAWCGKAASWLVIPMTLALAYEVFARYLFTAPTIWAYDVTYMFYGAHFMLGAAYALSIGAHIRTDFVYRLWPPKVQAMVDASFYVLLFFPAMVLFLYFASEFAWESWERLEKGITSPWSPPIYPFKTVIPVTILLLLIQGVGEFLKTLRAVREGEWQ